MLRTRLRGYDRVIVLLLYTAKTKQAAPGLNAPPRGIKARSCTRKLPKTG